MRVLRWPACRCKQLTVESGVNEMIRLVQQRVKPKRMLAHTFQDRAAVITGAGAGIGRALAVALAQRGARLALSDVDQAALQTTVGLCAIYGAQVQADVLDVRDGKSVQAYALEVRQVMSSIDLVFNNAGIIYTGGVLQSQYSDIENVLAVDFWGVVFGTKAFLPHLIASGNGYLVNVCSAYGMMAAPLYSAYNAAKFAVRGFTEAVQQDMKAEGHPVHVACVYPGAVATSILETSSCAIDLDIESISAKFALLARTSPEKAAQTILKGVAARRSRILIGPDAYAADLVTRTAGIKYQAIIEIVRKQIERRTAKNPKGALND